jgi:hypothetical protein
MALTNKALRPTSQPIAPPGRGQHKPENGLQRRSTQGMALSLIRKIFKKLATNYPNIKNIFFK